MRRPGAEAMAPLVGGLLALGAALGLAAGSPDTGLDADGCPDGSARRILLAAAVQPESYLPPPPPDPVGAPDMQGFVIDQAGEPVPCVGIYRADEGQRLRRFATTDAEGRWSAPCRHGRLTVLSFPPYVESTAPARWAFRSVDNPATAAAPCAERVTTTLAPAGVIAGRIVPIDGTPPGERRLEVTCTGAEQFSGLPLRVVTTDADGTFRVDGLARCGIWFVRGRGVELGTPDVVEGSTLDWTILATE